MHEPTANAEINIFLYRLLNDAKGVLANQFVGMYLHGSLALGDFNPRRSDIDFVIVTDDQLSHHHLEKLISMHHTVKATGGHWTSILEGSYIPRDHLRRFNPETAHYPALRVDGSFDVAYHGSDWIIQRWVLREHGITLAGPPPDTLIDPIAGEELRKSALGILREWWKPMLDDHYRLDEAEYQAYAALTMCRTLYTVEQQAVVSKDKAAEWAKEQHGHAELIDEALTWRHGRPMDRLDDVLAFIGYTLDTTK